MSDYAAQRLNMVDAQVRANDVTDLRIQKAMLEIRRERFLPPQLRHLAYIDGCPEVRKGRALPDPRSFAKLAQLAEIRAGDLVLDVGCASGYSTAVLARLAGRVIGLEEDAELVRAATESLREVANAEVVQGRLSDGLPQRGPYDAIFLNGATEIRPQALLEQLREGGRLVCIMCDGPQGHAHLFVRGSGGFGERIAFDAQIPVLPGFRRESGFVF